MKKILSLVLAILMSLSVASMIGAAEEVPAIEAEDTVVAATEEEVATQFDEAIKFLQEYGIFKGKGNGYLGAADAIKRYEMALFVSRIATGWVDDENWKTVWWVGTAVDGEPTVAQEWYDREHDKTGFTDLEGTAAADYLGALSYASQKRYILGYGNGKFGPEDGIRYEDALTMLCRVLEYDNLEWPWGYIEKATFLGLTVGIPSTVAYRDYLNRGQVAQLIYNALKAPIKSGGTLASRYFNGALEWKNIIITGAGYGRLLKDDLLKDGKLYDLGDTIAFRTIDENDGTVDASKTYFVNAKDLNWIDSRYERYLGYAYNALFTVNEDGYVTLAYYKPLVGKTVENRGRLEKVDDAYPIDTFLKDKNLVSKFTLKGNYLNNYNGEYNPTLNQFILKNAIQENPKDDTTSPKIAIQWNNGDNNIVVYETTKDAAGNTIVDKDKVETIWYYNSELKVYFKVLFDKDGNYYGIKLLDTDAIAELTKTTRTLEGGLPLIDSKPGTTAYADLTPFKIIGSSEYNYGLYEQYALGKFNTEDKAIDADGKEKNGFSVSAVNTLADYYWDGDSEYKNLSVGKIPTEGAGILGWYSELKPQNGDYIIYSFDPATRELKVIKIINKDTKDQYNYIGNGVVRGWKLADKSVNIDGKNYYFDYNELLGNGLYIHKGDSAYEKNAFTNFFRSVFNQYVEFLMVDDRIVYMKRAGSSDNIIVVDSYAGLSADGCIVVNGYSTADLKYAQFKIGSYNGWVKGDYFYYPSQIEVDKAFARGTIYKITSTKTGDDQTPVYYVYTIAQAVKYQYTQGDYRGYTTKYDFSNIDSAYVGGEPAEWKVTIEDGYKSFDEKTWKKAKSTDKYIFICNEPDDYIEGTYPVGIWGGNYAPIIVYQGTGASGQTWTASGRIISGTGADDPHVVIDAKVNGFNMDQWGIQYVLFLKYNYDSSAYDSVMGGNEYLLGASTFTAECLNLYTGKPETYIAVNKDLKKGYAYPAMDGHIIADGKDADRTYDSAPYDHSELNWTVDRAYTTNRKYVFGYQPLGYKNDKGEVKIWNLFDKAEFSKTVLSTRYNVLDKLSTNVLNKGGADDLTENDLTVIWVEGEDASKVANPKVTFWTYLSKESELIAKLSDKDGNLLYDLTTVMFWYVNDDVNNKTVVYVGPTGKAPVVPDEFNKTTEHVVDLDPEGGEHELTGVILPAYVVPHVYGETLGSTATITGIGFEFKTGPSTHANIRDHGLYFGIGGYEFFETPEIAVNGTGFYDTIHKAYYGDDSASDKDHDHADWCELIKEIKAPVTATKVYAPYYDKVADTYYEADGKTEVAESNIKTETDEKTSVTTITVKGAVATFDVQLADDVSSTEWAPVESTFTIEVWWDAIYKISADGKRTFEGNKLRFDLTAADFRGSVIATDTVISADDMIKGVK